MLANRTNLEPAKFSQRTLLGTLWAGVAVSFCFLLFRFYVRLKIFRRLHIEDPFVLAAWLMNLANAIVWQDTADTLYSVIAVESGQIVMPPPQYSSYVYDELHSLFSSYLLYYTALWSVKLSFLLFFRSLGKPIRRQMILWYCVLAFTITSYVVCLCMINYRCLVVPRGLAECQSSYAARNAPIYLRVATVLDTTTDGFIILMLTNLLWNASLELRKKLALTGIFSLTIFIISVSIMRVVFTTSGPRLDITWLLLWSGVEITVAIIVACLASFRILYTRSERSRRSASIFHLSNRAAERLGNGRDVPLKDRVVNPTHNIPSDNTRLKRQNSADTFEEALVPMDNVYVRRKFSVFPDPRERYEEKESPPKIHVVRVHGHWLPSLIDKKDTVWWGSRHLRP